MSAKRVVGSRADPQEEFNPPLQVVGLIATRRGDPERGPLIRMRAEDARRRLLLDGELCWVYGPRRHELAEVVIDDTLPRGGVVLRDIVGASPSETVRITKVDTDAAPQRGHLA